MNYNIHITDEADHDMNQAVDYIEFSLQNPVAADALMDAVDLAVSSLAHMPGRYRLVDDIVLASWGIRFIRVKNYLAFYTVSPKTAMVHIVRFLYAKSDWAFILRNSYIPET